MIDAKEDFNILVVEDEYIIARDLTRRLSQIGVKVVGPASSVQTAMDLINSTPSLHGALLDVNLNGIKVFPVADELSRRNIPLVFVTGYGLEHIPPGYFQYPACTKSESLGQILKSLATRTGDAPAAVTVH